MRKRFFGLGVAALALVLGLVQVPQAFALDRSGFFESTSERDNWLLKVLEVNPYYYYDLSSYQERVGAITLLPLNLNYQPNGAVNPNAASHAMTFYGKGTSETDAGLVTVRFYKTKAAAEEAMSLDALGPFETGSTAASRREAAKRILDCLTKWNADRSATLN